jgi:hypothetical protein
MAVVRCYERDRRVQVFVVVPLHEMSDPGASFLDSREAVPWISGRVLQMSEERFGESVVTADARAAICKPMLGWRNQRSAMLAQPQICNRF